jgi:hypothetical protein
MVWPDENRDVTAAATRCRGRDPEGRVASFAFPVRVMADRDLVPTDFFLMHSQYTGERLPQPTDARRRLRAEPMRSFAAIRYIGFWSRSRNDDRERGVREWIQRRALELVSEPVWTRYDPPLMPWFLRRNEVLVEVPEPGAATAREKPDRSGLLAPPSRRHDGRIAFATGARAPLRRHVLHGTLDVVRAAGPLSAVRRRWIATVPRLRARTRIAHQPGRGPAHADRVRHGPGAGRAANAERPAPPALAGGRAPSRHLALDLAAPGAVPPRAIGGIRDLRTSTPRRHELDPHVRVVAAPAIPSTPSSKR